MSGFSKKLMQAAAGNVSKITSVAFVGTTNDETLRALDISDPTNPLEISSLTSTTFFNDIRGLVIDSARQVLFCGSRERITAIDVSDPRSLSVVGNVFLDSSAEIFSCDLDTTNNILWAGRFEGGVYAIDVSNVSSMSSFGIGNVGGNDSKIYVGVDSGLGICLAAGEDMRLLEVVGSSPTDLDEINVLGSNGLSIDPVNKHVALADTQTRADFYSYTSNSISSEGSFTLPGGDESLGLTVFHPSRQHCYLIAGGVERTVYVCDVSNISSPSFLNDRRISNITAPFYVKLDEDKNLLYITSQESSLARLVIVDVSNSPSFIATLSTFTFSTTTPSQPAVLNYDPPI